jgi:uncharacterized membrane protein YhaH (DUF805 family)
MHIVTLAMMIFNLVLGVVITILALSINEDTQDSRCSGHLRAANTGCIVLGAILATASISFGVCQYSKGNLAADKTGITRRTLLSYYGFILCLSIILIVLGAIIMTEADKADTGSPCKKVKEKAAIIMTIGIIALVFCLLPVIVSLAKKSLKKSSM